MSSNFVFIVPDDWTIIPKEIVEQIGVNQVDLWVRTSNFYPLMQAIKELGGPEWFSEAVFFNFEVLAVR